MTEQEIVKALKNKHAVYQVESEVKDEENDM